MSANQAALPVHTPSGFVYLAAVIAARSLRAGATVDKPADSMQTLQNQTLNPSAG